MKLAGTYKLNVKKEIVWNALNDPKILKQCIQGCDSFYKENDNEHCLPTKEEEFVIFSLFKIN